MATTERSPGATAIRPFTVEIPEAEVEDLRTRIVATRLPEKEPVEDASQGVQLTTMQTLVRYWGHRVRPSQGREAAERPAAVPDPDRRSRYSLHPRQVAS
jgi:hypothetical protein